MSTIVIELDEDDLIRFDEDGYIDICPHIHVYNNLQHILIQKKRERKRRANMSVEYDNYLEQHKGNVAKGFYWIRDHLPELLDYYYGSQGELEHQICFAHDASKSDQEEYEAYDRYFYGRNRSYGVVRDFNYAWLRHIHHNPHHWQYWILRCDDPGEGEKILDMPYQYILEMICDWWAFSWQSGDLTEIFKWYDERKNYIKLSPATRKTVEDILGKIKNKLEESANE